MSLIATAAAGAASQVASFFVRGHKHGGHAGAAGNTSSTSGSATQGPTSTQGLFSSLLQSLEQVTGITATAPVSAVGNASAATSPTAAASPTTAASTTAAASTNAQNVHQFLHSLLQALKADGLGGTAGASATSPYAGSLTSSLQTLIGQVGSSTTPSGATANLTASFDSLLQGAGGAAATGSGSSSTTNSATLQQFLAHLLQNLQSGSPPSLSVTGGNVNAKV